MPEKCRRRFSICRSPIALRVSTVALPTCGNSTALSSLKNSGGISYNANMDPTANTLDHTEWPSSRHSGRADLLFCDGHTEAPKRAMVIDPKADNPWRNRWNNDDQPHNNVKWSINQTFANAVDF